MVFQGEDVLLDKDVLKPKSKEFVPTQTEWSSRSFNRKLIHEHVRFGVVNNFTILFTVPKNSTLFLTYISIGLVAITSATQDMFASLDLASVSGITKPLLRVEVAPSQTVNKIEAVSLSPPIEVQEGESILVANLGDATAGTITNGIIIGWLEPKQII